jgi:hypothetical protein
MDYKLDYQCLNKKAPPQFTLQEHQNYVSAPVAFRDESIKSANQDFSKEPQSKTRRSRIIQRIKTQQQTSTDNDGDRNALSLAKSKDARMQWRKLRRDARTKGRTLEQTNPEPGGEEGFQSRGQCQDDLTSIETEQPYRSAGMGLTEHTVNEPVRESGIDTEASQDVHKVLAEDAYTATKAQRLMQQDSSEPHSKTEPFNERVDSCIASNETSGREQRVLDEKNKPSSSNFKSLMSKWKSIEGGSR